MTEANEFDVCVIGSGFGGGPAALRATEAGASVVVLEQGARWDGRGDSREFKQTQEDLGYLTDLFEVSFGVDWNTSQASVVVAGKGLGGGSLVYSMVSLRAPSFVFDEPVWPTEVDRTELDPFYLKAENQLGITQVEWTGASPADDWKVASKRDAAFAKVCDAAGMSCDPIPSSINDNCTNLGWCSTGCTKGGKSSVDLRYMQPAEDLGGQIRVKTRVEDVRPAPGGSVRRWLATTTDVDSGDRTDVFADDVVFAAGAVGSAVLLQRSASHLPGGISEQCGRNLSRGGDMLIPLVLPDDFPLDDLEMAPGKIIGSCSFEHLFTPPPGVPDWQRFIVQPMMILPLISALVVADPDGVIAEGDMRGFGLGHKHLMQKWGSRLLHLGIMGMDEMDGTVRAEPGGGVTVLFGTGAKTRKLYESAHAAVDHMAASVGGRRLPSWDELRGDSLAVHPLGTNRVADTIADGVIDHRCRGRPRGALCDGCLDLQLTDRGEHVADRRGDLGARDVALGFSLTICST
jgi:hypothetical protein